MTSALAEPSCLCSTACRLPPTPQTFGFWVGFWSEEGGPLPSGGWHQQITKPKAEMGIHKPKPKWKNEKGNEKRCGHRRRRNRPPHPPPPFFAIQMRHRASLLARASSSSGRFPPHACTRPAHRWRCVFCFLLVKKKANFAKNLFIFLPLEIGVIRVDLALRFY